MCAAFASISGSQHYMTFDGRHYEFSGPCEYTLVQDLNQQDFAVSVDYVRDGPMVNRRALLVFIDDRRISLSSSGTVSYIIVKPVMYQTSL